MRDLVEKMLNGDRRALSRLLSLVDGQDQRAFDEFCSGAYEFGAQATAVALTAAASASASTDGSSTSRSTRSDDAILTGGYHKGAAVFTITKGGVLSEASIVGQKFSTQC